MSLIINQGVQDTSKDTSVGFAPIVENDVVLEINEITLCTYKPGALNVKFRLLSGAHKNQFVFDTVDYDASSDYSWKYRSLRSVAGVPYKQGEPSNIDIEALLKGKVIMGDLSIRAGKDKDGNPKDFQNIKYRKYTTTPVAPVQPTTPVQVAPTPTQVAPTVASTTAPTPSVVEFSDDDLPFNNAVEKVAQQPGNEAGKESTNKVVTSNDAEDWD